MSSQQKDDEVITAYPNYYPKGQKQELPGEDQSMDPIAEHINLVSTMRVSPAGGAYAPYFVKTVSLRFEHSW